MKKFGDANEGYLSFPSRGFAFCASFSTFSSELANFLDYADRELVNLSGRVYLAKDCRVKPDIVAQMYPKIAKFREVCDSLDPRALIQSDLSKRLRLRDV
jgi:decaprenylphospho-beta-D-ribofuranose 2-oxidase